MKKNRMMRVASVLLVAVLLTTCAISGTFAKYTTAVSGTDSARVAKWDIKLDGDKITDGTTMTFDLFNTINDTDGNPETDVAANLIAPGTEGSLSFTLKNDSEVTAEYTIDYTVTNTANIPVQFSLDGTDWKDSIDDLDVGTATKMAIGAAATTVTVYWQWVFNGNDTTDTNLGVKDTTDTLKVDVKVTATQVD